MDIRYDLPGVFQSNTFKAVNGSLWSIPFEVYAYIVLIAMFLFGVLYSKRLSVVFFLLILMDPVIGNKFVFTWLPQNPEVTLLAPCFAMGALSALFKDRFEINLAGLVGVWILYYLFQLSSYKFYFFYLAIFYSIVFLSSRRVFIRFKPAIDVSYGLYLWGWPVQQIMIKYFSECGIVFNQISSVLISALLGYVSWHLIESRFIRVGSYVGKRMSSKVVGASQSQDMPAA